MSADVIPIGRPEPTPARLELITVVGYGGLPLHRMLAVVEEGGEILVGSAIKLESEEHALATWQRVCEIMADAFDDETGTYYLERRRIDDHGRPVPGPPPPSAGPVL
jgi:hypothetical protein